jgi:hypothetical protein
MADCVGGLIGPAAPIEWPAAPAASTMLHRNIGSAKFAGQCTICRVGFAGSVLSNARPTILCGFPGSVLLARLVQ